MSRQEILFEQWLSGKLSQQEMRDIEAELVKDPLWKSRMDIAQGLSFEADNTAIQQVPKWDRAATFESSTTPWWQWHGLPVFSMAFSCFAIALVLLQVSVSVTNNGLTVRFGQDNSKQEMMALVEEKMNQFTEQQKLALINFSLEQANNQQASNLQLASYILDTSRQERKEDISDFIAYISAQRKDDQLEYRIKYRELEEALNYQGRALRQNKISLQPASWLVEE